LESKNSEIIKPVENFSITFKTADGTFLTNDENFINSSDRINNALSVLNNSISKKKSLGDVNFTISDEGRIISIKIT